LAAFGFVVAIALDEDILARGAQNARAGQVLDHATGHAMAALMGG